MSAPREKLPRTSPLANRTPRAERVLESCGEERRRRTTVLPEAIPRYSAVTSSENLPAIVWTSVLFFWSWAGSSVERRTARSPIPRGLERRFIPSSEPRRVARAFPVLPSLPLCDLFVPSLSSLRSLPLSSLRSLPVILSEAKDPPFPVREASSRSGQGLR